MWSTDDVLATLLASNGCMFVFGVAGIETSSVWNAWTLENSEIIGLFGLKLSESCESKQKLVINLGRNHAKISKNKQNSFI